VLELDHALQRLGKMPIPIALDTIDEGVFSSLEDRRRDALAASRFMSAFAAFALALGLVSGSLSVSEPAAAQPFAPFAPDSPLAPSTMLDVHP
jgi:hypothetical protein